MKLTGWTFPEIDASTGLRLDAILKIDELVNDVADERVERSMAGRGGGTRNWTPGGAQSER